MIRLQATPLSLRRHRENLTRALLRLPHHVGCDATHSQFAAAAIDQARATDPRKPDL